MKRMMIMLVAAVYMAMLYGGDAERLDELERICAAEPSDDLFRPQVISTPDDIIAKYHITTNQLIADLKSIAMKYNTEEQDEHKRDARSLAVANIGQYAGTNELAFLSTIMTNNGDYAQASAMGASIHILRYSPELVDLARGIVTNATAFSSGLRSWTCTMLISMCLEGRSSMYIDAPAQHARIAAFFVDQTAIPPDVALTMDDYACILNPWYRHSQQRRDNLARLRPPGLTGRRAELYDAAQRDAAQED